MDNFFHPGCPECAQEQGANGVPIAPGKHRHAQSDPAEPIRKELTQCQYCFKSRAAGVTLQKCAACKIDIYCVCYFGPVWFPISNLFHLVLQSKECQKKAWPTHKSKCKLNRLLASGGPTTQLDVLKNLRAFTSKHRPTIAEASLRALEVCVDPSRAFRDVVVIFLESRSGSTRTETSFFATGADVVPFESFGPVKAEEMRGQLKLAHDNNIRTGMMGAVFAILCNPSSGAMNVCPIGFPKDIGKMMYAGMPWKEWMLNRLNEGIVS